ncbi:Thiazole biosynthesis protein ThiG [hydrothermal vent metagenome]|uniref:Thiazole biosynthesis protein ThiG n=1 Tax=hydrothermal vent metagenome TaxID=652676 RepID=A0A3B0RVP7_9ZZZZ
MIEITINGDPHNVKQGQNLDMLLQDLNLDPAKVAVERNLEIVPKTTYQDVIIMAGDRLEIVHFIGGGK